MERGECEVEVCPSMFMNFWQNEPCETCITSQIFLGRATLTTKPSIEELAATFIFSHHPTSTTKLCLHTSNLFEGFATEPLLSCHGRCLGLSVGEGEKQKCDQDLADELSHPKFAFNLLEIVQSKSELKVPIDKLSLFENEENQVAVPADCPMDQISGGKEFSTPLYVSYPDACSDASSSAQVRVQKK